MNKFLSALALAAARLVPGSCRRCRAHSPAGCTRPGDGSRRFGGASGHGVRHAASGYRAAARQGAAAGDGSRSAVATADSGRVLVRQETPRVALGPGKARAARHRHLGYRQRRQHGEARDAARRALWRRLSRPHHAVAHLPRLHRVDLQHGRGGRSHPGRAGFVRGDGGDHRPPAAQGKNYRHRRARVQPGRRERRHREVHRRRRSTSSTFTGW